MIRVPVEFRQKLYRNERDYLLYADITLSDGTVLNLENDQIWNNGMSIEDAVSEDDSFTALGAAILGAATLTINNMNESFSDYDFMNAKVILRVGLELSDGSGGTRVEDIQKGVFTVDDTSYNGALVVLTMLDNMEQFDRPYNNPLTGSKLAYPASLGEIVRNACTNCSVTLNTVTFPHDDFIVQKRPIDDALTYREVIGWAASIAGCFARCDRYGRLELKWFDRASLEARNQGYDGGEFDSSTPYSTGDAVNGGTFNPWNTGDAAEGGEFTDERMLHYIYALYSQNISMDDVVITGVRILVDNDDENSDERILAYTSGQTGYMVEISDNDFITKTNAQAVANWLGTQLIGLAFRKASVTHANDPSIEAGDIGVLFDRKNREYPILITRTVFSVGSAQETVSGAETPSRNGATRYTSVSKSWVASRKLLNKEQSIREQAMLELERSLASKSGLYMTVEATASGNIYYLHDHPDLEDSAIVWKMTKDAVGVTNNYDGDDTVWSSGLTVDGTLITQLISTVGLDASWINTGFLSATRIKGGSLTLGGSNNVNGVLTILAADGTTVIGKWDKDGITANTGGKLTSKNGRVYFDLDNNELACDRMVSSDSSNVFVAQITNFSHNGAQVKGFRLYNSSNANVSSKIVLIPSGDSSNPDRIEGGSNGLKVSNGLNNAGVYATANKYLGLYGGGVSNTQSSIEGYTTTQGLILIEPYYIVSGTTYNSAGNIRVRGSLYCNRTIEATNLTISNVKSRVVDTDNYQKRLLYCYEMPSPMFGDIGEGVTDEDGFCVVEIDDIFGESVCQSIEYQVFLQKEGPGDIWVDQKEYNYFVVRGTPNLKFSWEIKAKQRDFEMDRLELYDRDQYADMNLPEVIELQLEDELDRYISEQEEILYETA